MRHYGKLTGDYKKLADDFIRYESFRGIRRAENCVYLLKPLFAYLEEKDIPHDQVSEKDAQEFQTYLSSLEDSFHNLYYSSSTVSAIMGMSSRFYAFLSSTGQVIRNPFLKVKRVKLEHRLPRNLPNEEKMDRFLKNLSQFWKQKTHSDQKLYYKSHVMAELMYASGLRISEVLSLKEEDIDFDRMIINVKNGKGGKDRKAYLNEYAAMVLKIYLNQMRDLVSTRESDSIFAVENRSTISATFHKVLKKEVERIGLEEFPSHSFRHTLGFHLLRRGCDMRFIQLILGHEDMNTTTIYTKVEKSDLRDELDRYHPRRTM